jgi:hypothetical protein
MSGTNHHFLSSSETIVHQVIWTSVRGSCSAEAHPHPTKENEFISAHLFTRHSWFGSSRLEMAALRDCTRNLREIVGQSLRGMEAVMTIQLGSKL